MELNESSETSIVSKWLNITEYYNINAGDVEVFLSFDKLSWVGLIRYGKQETQNERRRKKKKRKGTKKSEEGILIKKENLAQ